MVMKNTKAVSYYDEGVFRKTRTPLIAKSEIQLQAVGKWVYYKEPHSYPEKIHKIQIDGAVCTERKFEV